MPASFPGTFSIVASGSGAVDATIPNSGSAPTTIDTLPDPGTIPVGLQRVIDGVNVRIYGTVGVETVYTMVQGAGDWSAMDDATPVAPIGSGYGSTKDAVAGWVAPNMRELTDMPYLGYTETGIYGILATHVCRRTYGGTGILWVKVSLDGGPIVTIRGLTLNTETGRYSFNVRVDSTTCDDAILEMRYIVQPIVGMAVTGSINLVTNAGKTLPYPTVYCSSDNGNDANDGLTRETAVANWGTARAKLHTLCGGGDSIGGGVILMGPGSQSLQSYTGGTWSYYATRWVTTAADIEGGTVPADCPINAQGDQSNQVGIKWFRLYKGILRGVPINLYHPSISTYGWMDYCVVDGISRFIDYTAALFTQFTAGGYATHTEFKDIQWAAQNMAYVGNCDIKRVSSQALKGCSIVVATKVHDLNRCDNITYNEFHPDLHYRNGAGHQIWEGVKATHCYSDARGSGGQTLFTNKTDASNWAFLNCLLDGGNIDLAGNFSNAVFDSITFLRGTWAWDGSGIPPTPTQEAVTITNSIINSMIVAQTTAEVIAGMNNNHFVSTGEYGEVTYGTNYTEGNDANDVTSPDRTTIFTNPNVEADPGTSEYEVIGQPDFTPVCVKIITRSVMPSRWGPQDVNGDLYAGTVIGAVTV